MTEANAEADLDRSKQAVMALSEANAAFVRRLNRNDQQLYRAAVALLHQRTLVCRGELSAGL